MKKIGNTILLATVLSGQVIAVDMGSLDQSFSQDGVTDGWDTQGSLQSGLEYYGGDIIVDSQGRVLVAGTYEFELSGGQEAKAAQLLRYTSSGQLDNTFGINGQVIMAIPPAPIDQLEYELALDSTDGVFVGYSREFCPTVNSSDCHSDVRVYHINSSGSQVGALTIPFDLGGTFDRQDDIFADLIFIESQNKVVVVAEVERTGADDTDFGVAVINNNPVSGELSLDTSFSSDGKDVCYFDQFNSSGSQDSTRAVAHDSVNNTIIVGGSAFEGNGTNNDGWNMAFCEYDMAGNNIRQWSTIDPGLVVDSREFVSDMSFAPNPQGVMMLTVAGSVSGQGGLDFAVTRFARDLFGDMSVDTTFGPNGNGWSTIPFNYIFVGDTYDTPSEMHVGSDGSLLLAGTIQNPSNNGSFRSAVALSMIRKDGKVDTTWGFGQTGKAVHSFDTISFWDAALGLAENPLTKELYITGFTYNGNFNMLTAKLHNDRIFASNFDN
jgi:hypothetical protein